MPSKLFLRPIVPVDPMEPRFEWAIYDLAGNKLRSGGSIELLDIEQTCMQQGIELLDLILLWPAAAAYTTTVKLPGNQTRYIQQALPFAVEEHFAVDVESLHLSLGAKGKDGAYKVVGLDAGDFATILELCQQFESFKLKAAYLDAEVLLRQDQAAVMYLGREQVLLQHRNGQAIGLHRENLLAYLDSVFLGDTTNDDAEQLVAQFKVYLPEQEQQELVMTVAEMEQYPGIELDVEAVALNEFELLCESFNQKVPLPTNLCQGDFKLANSSAGNWYKWRAVAAILLIGFIVQLGVFVGKGVYFNQQAELIGNQALSEYQKVVPGSQNLSVAKLPRVIKGKLNQSKQQGSAEVGFLSLLGEAGSQFQKATNKTGFVFQSINFNAQRGELVMEMRAQNFEQLDRLKQAIVGAGLSAKISSAVQEDNYFRGRISVGG